MLSFFFLVTTIVSINRSGLDAFRLDFFWGGVIFSEGFIFRFLIVVSVTRGLRSAVVKFSTIAGVTFNLVAWSISRAFFILKVLHTQNDVVKAKQNTYCQN